MPITIIGPQAAAFPALTYPAMIDVKPTWSDDWQFTPELELLGASATAGRELSSCQLGRRYGPSKLPWESAVAGKSAWGEATNWRLRVPMVGQQGFQQAWVGRVSGEGRNVQGASMGPSGDQSWQCYGPGQILHKIPMSTSFWLNGVDPPKEIGWVPSMNDRDGRQAILGNKAQGRADVDPSFVYGGTDVWTNYDYAEYLLARFVDTSSAGGPAWSLGGQTDVLADIVDVIRFGTTQTAADVLRELIPTRLGVDYTIRPTDDGFEVFVFALLAEAHSFGGHTLPRNPNTVEARVGLTSDNLSTRVAGTADHQYGRIRVLGRRVVVCCSLCGESVVQAALTPGTLVAKWPAALETEYGTCQAAVGFSGAAEAFDRYRQQEVFIPVFQQLGAPKLWDFNGGAAAPKFDDAGQLQLGQESDYQTLSRQTLTWLPLLEGVDYSFNPAVDNNPDGYEPELRKPNVWLAEENDMADGGYSYLPAEHAGVSISVPNNDWGVWLSASPNHLLALADWASKPSYLPTDTEPKYDWRRSIATIALELDQRLQLVYTVPGGGGSDAGTIDIEVPDAELWYLAPHTVVDLTDDEWSPTLKHSTATTRILRNDTDRLAAVMAGAIARYATRRARASITVRGLLPWSGLIGQILTVIDEGGQVQQIQAPITSVRWSPGEDPTTVIETGSPL